MYETNHLSEILHVVGVVISVVDTGVGVVACGVGLQHRDLGCSADVTDMGVVWCVWGCHRNDKVRTSAVPDSPPIRKAPAPANAKGPHTRCAIDP